MPTTEHTPRGHRQDRAGDGDLLPGIVAAVEAAGAELLRRFAASVPPATLEAMRHALAENDAAALAVLRPALERVRPTAGWAEDEHDGGALPPGEWWVVDPVEGNVNHVHGLPGWAVTATLVRDGAAVLTVVHLPLADRTLSATRGGGAGSDGAPLRVSSKTDLRAALVGTGQARPDESRATHRLHGRSVTAMLDAALVVTMSVPSTLQLIDVAAGRTDVFWQYTQVRAGLMAGALLVAEAGGTVSDAHGQPWTPDSEHFLAGAPGVHAAAVSALSSLDTTGGRTDGGDFA